MILVDTNLLLYAVNSDMPQHQKARSWWEGVLSLSTPVALTWPVVLGFLRISTHPRVFERPLHVDAAHAYVDEWQAMPSVRWLNPGPMHWLIFRKLLATCGTGGNLTTDAHLAALAMEHSCSLFSADNDFKRFPGLVYVNPLAQESSL